MMALVAGVVVALMFLIGWWYAYDAGHRAAGRRCSCRPEIGYVCTAARHGGEFDGPRA